jgi:hypothetical protein
MLDKLETIADATTIELPHSLETELWCLVTANHQITLQGITQQQEEMLNHMERSLEGEDPDTKRSVLSAHENFYEELRQASRNLALVGIVTRLQRWINRLTRQAFPLEKPQWLPAQLRSLNKKLGEGPIKVEFFEELVTARDAIIHNDALATEWEFQGKKRRVADRYVYGESKLSDDELGEAGLNTLELNLSEDHLVEAVQNSVAQVKWYDDKLNPLK